MQLSDGLDFPLAFLLPPFHLKMISHKAYAPDKVNNTADKRFLCDAIKMIHAAIINIFVNLLIYF